MIKAFSPLAEFLANPEAQRELEDFFLTPTGKLFLAAIRDFALHSGNGVGATAQDGARATCDQMVKLTTSAQNESKQNADGSIKGSERPKDEDLRPPILRKQLNRRPPPPPSLRGNPALIKPEEPLT